jgi:hypothetical protein
MYIISSNNLPDFPELDSCLKYLDSIKQMSFASMQPTLLNLMQHLTHDGEAIGNIQRLTKLAQAFFTVEYFFLFDIANIDYTEQSKNTIEHLYEVWRALMSEVKKNYCAIRAVFDAKLSKDDVYTALQITAIDPINLTQTPTSQIQNQSVIVQIAQTTFSSTSYSNNHKVFIASKVVTDFMNTCTPERKIAQYPNGVVADEAYNDIKTFLATEYQTSHHAYCALKQIMQYFPIKTRYEPPSETVRLVKNFRNELTHYYFTLLSFELFPLNVKKNEEKNEEKYAKRISTAISQFLKKGATKEPTLPRPFAETHCFVCKKAKVMCQCSNSTSAALAAELAASSQIPKQCLGCKAMFAGQTGVEVNCQQGCRSVLCQNCESKKNFYVLGCKQGCGVKFCHVCRPIHEPICRTQQPAGQQNVLPEFESQCAGCSVPLMKEVCSEYKCQGNCQRPLGKLCCAPKINNGLLFCNQGCGKKLCRNCKSNHEDRCDYHG